LAREDTSGVYHAQDEGDERVNDIRQEDAMKWKITTTVAAASLAIWYGVGTRPTTASAQAGTDMSQMTPAEHVAYMAAMGNPHAEHALMDMAVMGVQAAPQVAVPQNLALPADNMGAAARLAASPRRGQQVTIDVNGTQLITWVVGPAGGGRHPVIVVIHDVNGLGDWPRAVGDQLAAEGFVAVVPDLLSGHGPNGGGTASLPDQMAITNAILALTPEEIATKLNAARDYALKLPNANGKSGVIGFCFGGNQSFYFAVMQPALDVAVSYYGVPPTDVVTPGAPPSTPPPGGAAFVPSDRVANIKAPMLAFYGGPMQDMRVTGTLPQVEAKMKAFGKTFEPHVMEGASHGFLRNQGANNGANLTATQTAWPLTLAWLKKYTS
jgi:carboxymethylenebutenolidase